MHRCRLKRRSHRLLRLRFRPFRPVCSSGNARAVARPAWMASARRAARSGCNANPRVRLIRPSVPPIVHEVLRSPGQPLDPATRAFMEPRFGHDFGPVRVHTDARAAQSAQSVNALAYTVGRDVVFDAGQYAPHTREGKSLMAHELTHVVQQRDAPAPRANLVSSRMALPSERTGSRCRAGLACRKSVAVSRVVCRISLLNKAGCPAPWMRIAHMYARSICSQCPSGVAPRIRHPLEVLATVV